MPTWTLILGGLAGGFILMMGLVVVGFKVILPRVVAKGVGAMFAAKGAVLKGADVLIGAVSAAQGPPRNAFQEEDDHRAAAEEQREGGRWIRFEATITPQAPSGEGGFSFWEPDELSLVPTPASGKLDLDKMDSDSDLECFVVRRGDVPGSEDDEEMKIQGPCQVEVTAYVPSHLDRVSLHYYTQLVGDPITLP